MTTKDSVHLELLEAILSRLSVIISWRRAVWLSGVAFVPVAGAARPANREPRTAICGNVALWRSSTVSVVCFALPLRRGRPSRPA
jgi:hypothetical protein